MGSSGRDAAPPAAAARRRPLWPRRLLLALVALLAALVGAELAVRVLVPRDRFLSQSDLDSFVASATNAVGMLRPDRVYGHVPELGGRVYDDRSLLRPGRERTGRRPYTLFLGDSVTRRGRLTRALSDYLPAATLWNAGVEAWNPIQEVPWFLEHTRGVGAERVVLTLHNNDFQFTPVGLTTAQGFAICTPDEVAVFSPALYRQSWLYRLWVNANHRGLTHPRPQPAMAAEVEAALRRLRDALVEDGVPLTVLLLPPFPPREQWEPREQEAYELASAMLPRLGVTWIDLGPPIDELHGAGIEVLSQRGDRWHPNNEAARAMIFHALQRGLSEEWPGQLRAATLAARAEDEVRQVLELDMGAAHAGARYQVLGNASGLGGGLRVGAEVLPLRADAYATQTLLGTAAVLDRGTGRLDDQGRATIAVRGPDCSRAFAPAVLHHVAVVFDEQGGIAALSNVVPLLVAPPRRR